MQTPQIFHEKFFIANLDEPVSFGSIKASFVYRAYRMGFTDRPFRTIDFDGGRTLEFPLRCLKEKMPAPCEADIPCFSWISGPGFQSSSRRGRG